MKEVKRYQCEFCKKEFKTPNRHFCKHNPELKNCFTCKYCRGWSKSEDGVDVGCGTIMFPNYPDCEAEVVDYDIEILKSVNYNLQCTSWEFGEWDWSKDEEINPFY